MNKYRMLSLDTSSTVTGYAYYEAGVLVESGVINKNTKEYKKMDSESRLNDMCKDIYALLKRIKPQTIVCEMTVVERGASTQRMLSEIVGSVRGWAIYHNCEFALYRPTQWRKIVCDQDERLPEKETTVKYGL